MKKFKNVFLLAAMAVSAVCVSSCGDDDETPGGGNYTITASGITLPSGITVDSVYMYIEDGIGVSAKYENGFTLTLPTPTSLSLLSKGSKVTVTPSDVMAYTVSISIMAVSKTEYVGEFSYGTASGISTEFYYVDKDVIIDGESGNNNYSTTYKLALKKGWNIVYQSTRKSTSGDTTYDYTTAAPSGVVWYFEKR